MNLLKQQLIFLLLGVPATLAGQVTLEPMLGYHTDINNRENFRQISIAVQFTLINKPVYQMLVGLSAGIPASRQKGTDIAYSPSPGAALEMPVNFQASLAAQAIQLSNRVKLFSWQQKNTLSVFAYAGLVHYKIKVAYKEYDTGLYSLLNPHRNLEQTGPFLGGGIQCKRKLAGGHIFLQTDICSPPAVERVNNYNYTSPALFSVRTGYQFTIHKRNR